MFKGIKDKASKIYLNKEKEVKRTPMVLNYADAKSIGLLYLIKDADHFNYVKDYLKHLKEHVGIKERLVFSFVNDKKEVPEFVQKKLEYDYFTAKDINWHNKPSGVEVENFLRKDFDILIDLTTEPCVPLQYVLKNSRAKFKVGKFSEQNSDLYDLMLDTPDNTIKALIEQVNHYLALINRKA